MTNHSNRPTSAELLICVLRFLALEPERQIEELRSFTAELKARNLTWDLQHPIVELCESLCKVPWSSDSPVEITQLLEELDSVTSLMFREKELTEKFTTGEALLSDPVWRVLRRIAKEALERCLSIAPNANLNIWELLCYVSD